MCNTMYWPKKYTPLSMILIIVLIQNTNSELAEQLDCPEDCDCHYLRINWVTDCSESNLTQIPFEGLDTNVYILNMIGNNLKEIEPFPEDIKVRTLQLADNMLQHIHNDTFSNLRYLLDIDLSGNNITTLDSHAFVNNPGLITVELQQNPLDIGDGPIFISKSVLYLYLSDCNLSKLSSLSFSNTTGLNTLDLSGNPLRIVETGIFDPLINLETLKLNRCNLTHIAGVAFNTLVHLKVLELSHNNLKHQVDWALVLGNLARLELLDLKSSGISNLPENTFIKNPWLRTLILAENELAGLDVATTLGHNLIHLDTLDISYCHLTEPLTETPFLNATKLRTLILSGNHLSSVVLSEALAPLTRLQTLSLRDCGLTRLPANTFHRFNSLQKLDISYNPLNNAFTGLLSPLESLEHLDMGYSNLKTISRDTFVKMNSLKTLILSGNKLDSLESGLFQNLTHLETLELNYCGLSKLNQAVFYENYTYPDLEELRLAGNPLKLDLLGTLIPKQLSKLKILDLRDCKIEYLPSTAFSSSKNITKLLLSDNKLSNLPNKEMDTALEFLEALQHLVHLDLSNNNFSSISPKVFKNNPDISTVKLVGNPWKCDCNVVDMWQWASQERGDIGMLIGSTTAAADSVSSGSKKKKALLCYLDSKTTPIKEGKLRRPGRELLNHVNRTWARYVREADCPWNHTLKPARILNRRVRSVLPLIQPPKVSEIDSKFALMSSMAGVLLVMVSIFGALYAYRRRMSIISVLRGKQSIAKSSSLAGRESNSNLAEIIV